MIQVLKGTDSKSTFFFRHRNIYNMMRGSSPGPTLLYVTPEKVSSSTQLLVGFSFLYAAPIEI